MTAAILSTRIQELEEALRAAEQRQRLLFLDHPLPLWVYDCETLAFLDVNGAVTSHYGYTRDELLRMTLLDLHQTEDHATFRESLPPADAPSKRLGPWRHITKGGRLIEVETVSQPWSLDARLATVVDVSERNEALRAAQRSRQQFETLVENSPDLVCRFDCALRCVYVSGRVQGLTGGPPTDYVGKQVSEVGLPDSLARILEPTLQDVLRTREQRAIDFAVVAADGSSRHVESLLTPELDTAAGVTSVLVVTRDITRRKRTEEALRESEARFRSLAELSNDWYWEQDEQLRFLQADAAITRKTGGMSSSYLGKTRWEIPGQLISDAQRRALDELLTQRLPFRDFVIKREIDNGEVRVHCISGMPIFDASGRFTGYRGVGRDITEQEALRAALAESEERIRLATEFGHIGTWERDLATGRLRWSRTVGPTLGLPPGSAVPTVEDFLRFVHPDDIRRLNAARRSWMEDGPDLEIEHRVIWPDGSVHWVRQRGRVQRMADGRPRRTLGIIEDVTERKATELALRESEERFRTLTELSSDWYWEQDADLRFTMISENAHRIMNWPPGSAIGKTRWETQHAGVPEQAWAEHRRTVESRQPFRDFVVQRPDGEGRLRTHSVSGMPVFDTSGRFCGYRGVGRDITEKAALQRALAESEERIRLATEFGSIGTWGRDLVTGHPSWSRNMGPILGFLEGTVLPSVETFLQVLHPDDRERFESERLAWLERGGEAETEYRVVCPDGTIRWIYQRGSVEHTTGARPLRMFGIVQDITERKRAELALRESEERFRLLAENVPEVFWISTPDFSRVLYVSPAYEQVWGRSRAELYRHPEEWLAAISQEDRPRLAGFLKRQGLGLPAQVEGRILRADGSMRWVWAESFPFASSAGERLVTGIVHDVTERKREQERKLEEATQQRDALVREVHHRIKNNLQGVAGLLRQYAQRNPGLVGVLETAIAQVQSIAIVHGLQGARDPSAGVVLCDIVAAIAQMLQRLTQARIELPGVSAANRGTRLAGDEIVPTALVLNELMMNAVKHYAASEGSGAIVVELERDARQARLTVRNPGRLPEGFDFAAQTRVGTGLGLVRALMPANGMSLDIHPIDGQVEAVLTLVPPVILSAGAEGD